jgi:hypothetical protein
MCDDCGGSGEESKRVVLRIHRFVSPSDKKSWGGSNFMMRICLLFAAVLALGAGSALADDASRPALPDFIKGYTWGWVGYRGQYEGPGAANSMKRLAETGTQWVCIAFGGSMKTFDTPEIRFGSANPRMVSDDEIRHAIELARQNGMKVILKPVVNCDDNTWRAWIKFYKPNSAAEVKSGDPAKDVGQVKDLEKWDQWWKSYSDFILHYAKIAEEMHVPIFCLGCEMNSTEEFVDHWRELIGQVRKVYSGLLTYDVNHDRENEVHCWDDVDFISISAYYAIRPSGGRSLEEAVKQTTPVDEIVAGLQGVKKKLTQVSARWHKPILFIETGVMNVRGFARYPWSHPDEHVDSPLDEQEQANFYEAMFQVFWNEPWFMGYTWWEWPAQIPDGSPAQKGRTFSVDGKKAEAVLHDWYAKPAAAKSVK